MTVKEGNLTWTRYTSPKSAHHTHRWLSTAVLPAAFYRSLML